MNLFTDEYYMKQALKEAELALEADEIPIGAVMVCNDKIIARTHNQTEMLNDVTAHAEMLAITAAANALGAKYLDECTLYVTLEPCPMCAGAIVLARPDRVVWGVSDPKRGGSTVFDILRHPGMNHHPEIVSGILEERCKAVLVDFFKQRRAD